MKIEFNHMCSNVHDMDKTVAFYQDVFGAIVTCNTTMQANPTRCVYMQLGHNLIEFIEPHIKTPETPFGLKHVAYETDDIDALYKYFIELGYKFSGPPKVAGTGNGRLAFTSDVNGVSIEFLERENGMRRPYVEPKIITAFDHYSICVDDLDSVYKLYTEYLQMEEFARFYIEDCDLNTIYLKSDKDILELLHYDTPAHPKNPHISISLRVENVREAVAKLIEAGIDISVDNIKKSVIGIGETITLQDPDGVTIELLDRPALEDLEANGYTPETLSTLRTL